MTTQLALLDNGARPWRLDEATRAAGLRGVALARSALRSAARAGDQAGPARPAEPAHTGHSAAA
jgi:hypothetical protein